METRWGNLALELDAERIVAIRFPVQSNVPCPDSLQETISTYLETMSPDTVTSILPHLSIDHIQPFSLTVLRTLTEIPEGKVSTYKEIARRLGDANAARAIGTILSKNPWPLLFPCHRVVPSSYAVGKYIWGENWKIQFLRQEGVVVEEEAGVHFVSSEFVVTYRNGWQALEVFT